MVFIVPDGTMLFLCAGEPGCTQNRTKWPVFVYTGALRLRLLRRALRGHASQR